jgi:ligand-binding sensor domain-containing protein
VLSENNKQPFAAYLHLALGYLALCWAQPIVLPSSTNMKRVLPWFLVLLLFACEQAEEIPPVLYPEKFDDPVNTDFSTKILDGFFVTAIAFDKQGNAWIGTFSQGLIKYNPQETIVFDSSNSVIPKSPIWDVAVDSKNNVWIGSSALIKFDGSRFTTFNSGNSKIPEDYISFIAVDSKDNIWFASCRFRQGGLVRYDGSQFAVYTPENSPLPASLIHGIAIDINDNVWLAFTETVTETYLVKISGGRWRIFSSNDFGFSPYYISNIDINSDNEVCAAIDYSLSSTWPNLGPQIFIFDGKVAVQMQFDNVSKVHHMMVDRSDHIWCATWDGYAIYDGDQWMLDNTTFSEESVFTIEQAPDARIWVGTGNGIYINN